MKRLSMTAALTVAAAAGALGLSGSAFAAQKTVCAHNCTYTTIQAAIDAAGPGDTITIGPGKYVENLTVDEQVTLQGSGDGTVLYPALSAPNPCTGSSLCGGAASNIILVQADNVTISKMRLEGDNPDLTSGLVVGGADLDTRNGIITNHTLGTWNNLTVSDVKISDIYLRGVYASSGGTFTFVQNTVDNVRAEGASIAMFNFGGSGLFAANKVTNANDGIASNWSTGTQYLGNDVEKSASGIHSDNNGGFGGVGDTIKGNRVHHCTTDGYGVWTFAPYVAATVVGNKVEGCAVGLAAFASSAPSGATSFVSNDVKADGAKATGTDGTFGAYLSTDILGFGPGQDVNVTLTGNSFELFDTGVLATETRYFYGDPAGGTATVVAHDNSFEKNGVGWNGETAAASNAENNWWGCKEGPNQKNCDTTLGLIDYTPWLTKRPKL